MNLNATRRNVLGAMASLVGVAAPFQAAASPGESRSSALVSNDEKTTLTVALLESHWEALQELADAYAESEGFEIDAYPLPYGELYSQLSLALTQQAPTFDVVSLEDPWIPQFASFLAPIDVPSDLIDGFVPIAAALSRYPDGAPPCSLPWVGDAQFFGARLEWLDRSEVSAPETWDDVLSTAAIMSANIEPDSGQASFAISTLSGQDLVRSFLPILQGYGKALIDQETSVPQLDTPEALAAIETFEALAQLSPPESSAPGEPSNVDRFESGQVAMMSNFWSCNLLQSGSVEQVSAVGPIDSTTQPAQLGIPRQTMTGVWLLGIPRGSIYPDEARKLLQWLAGDEAQRQLPERLLPPVRRALYSDAELISAEPALPLLLELLESATPRPRSPFYPQLEQLLAAELGNVLAGEKTGAEALKDTNVAIREFLVREGVLTV